MRAIHPSLVCLAAALAAAAPGQLLVALTGVPDDLGLPLPAGRTVLITATVTGAEVNDAWLGRAADPRARVPLVRVGDGEYELHLADPAVAALARAAGSGGSLEVFVRQKDGSATASTALRYALRTGVRGPHLRLHEGGVERRLEWASPAWVTPRRVDRIEIDLAEPHFRADATARIGARSLPLVLGDGDTECVRVDTALALAWQEQGDLVIGMRSEPDAPLFVLRARPEHLCRDGQQLEFRVAERTAVPIPDGSGYLRLSLGDVTGQQATMRLDTVEGETLLFGKVLSQGLGVSFRCAGTSYDLVVTKLVNAFFGEDYATFALRRSPALSPADRALILRAFARIEAAPVTIVQNSMPQDKSAFLGNLRWLHEDRDTIRSVDDLIQVTASNFKVSTRVRLADGTELEMGAWLREQIETLRATPDPRK